MCIDDEGINYLKSIQKNMRIEEIKLIKQIALKKALKEKQHEQTRTLYIINS